MHLRRALLLFALVLGLTALAASLAPPPAQDARTSTQASSPPPTTPSDPGEQRVAFRFPARRGTGTTRRVKAGQPVVVFVSAKQAGQATIPLLGRVAALTPEDPARFDLRLPVGASYDVRFTPVEGGEGRRIGKLVTAAG
ncbi:MAG: hypothetical protein QOG63_2989 [Thermoleophilaceae bacterium]|nr:hypothetical protein [Thermoleophilaceae bacterium]